MKSLDTGCTYEGSCKKPQLAKTCPAEAELFCITHVHVLVLVLLLLLLLVYLPSLSACKSHVVAPR